MTGLWRAEADDIAPAQRIERTQKMMLVGQPAFMFAITAARSSSAPIRNGLPHFLPRPMQTAPAGTPAVCLLRTSHIVTIS